MTSPPLDTVKRRPAWHATIAFRQHTRSNNVSCGMPSSPLGSTNGRTTSSVACHHRLWTSSHSRRASSVACVEQHWAWHAIIVFVKHTRSNDVGRGITTPPLDSIHGQMTSGVACHHRLWAAHTVERRRARHAIRALGQHTWSNDVGCGIPSWTFDNTHS